EALRAPARRLEPVGGDPGRLLSEQPAELAGVRREHGRRSAVERLEPEERVCVHDGRQLALGQQTPNELAPLVGAAETGSDRERARTPGSLEDLVQRTLDGLDDERLQHGHGIGRRAVGYVAAV